MSDRSPLVIANWKLNGSFDLINAFNTAFNNHNLQVQIGVCPPYVFMSSAAEKLKENKIEVGAQTISLYDSGAYTGEISAQMVTQAGAFFTLIGHSERRAIFNETDSDCNKKLQITAEQNVYAVLCVGESEQERKAEQTEAVVKAQLIQALKGIALNSKTLCIAYEPVWAIGTGLSATPEMAQDVHQFIRSVLTDLSDEKTANQMHILYGGSVKKDTAKELMQQADIDGLLVGGASLDADHFFEICKQASV